MNADKNAEMYRRTKEKGGKLAKDTNVINGDVITAIFADAGRGKRADWSGSAGSWPGYPNQVKR